MRAPLQSRKPMVRIAPFTLKMVAPTSVTTTGWDDLLSGSGGEMYIVNTEPKLVPTQSVGVNTEGSATAPFCYMHQLRNLIQLTWFSWKRISKSQTLNGFGSNVLQAAHGTRTWPWEGAVELIYAAHKHIHLLVLLFLVELFKKKLLK